MKVAAGVLRLPDPRRSRAVLVGASEQQSLARLRDLLTDPGIWGLPAANCVTLAGELAEPLPAATETLLLYVSGPADHHRVRRAVAQSRCRSKVVILDCGCPSARVPIPGAYVLAARTPVLGALVRLLGDGLSGGPELLTAEALYWRLRDEVHPAPVQRGAGHLVLARNRAFTPEPPPAPAAGTPWLAPAAVLGRLADMRTSGGHRAAGMLLDAIGAGRVAAEVAGIAEALDAAGAPADADRVLAAAFRRPAGEAAAVLRALHDPAVLDRARRAVAEADIAAIAARLDPAGRDALLDAAAEARFGRPAELIGLVAAVSAAAGLGGAVDGLLERTAARTPPEDAATLGDVLRDAGREDAAFRLYQVAGDAVARRPAAAVVALAADLLAAGHADQARQLIGRAAGHCAGVTEFLDLLGAAGPAGLPHATGDVITEAARTLPADALLVLAAELGRTGRDAEAGELLAWAAATRPVAETVALLRGLAGHPTGIRRVTETAARRDPGEIAALVTYLETADPLTAEVLVEGVLAAGAVKTGQVMVLLEQAGRPEALRRIVDQLTTPPAAGAVPVMAELVRAGRRVLSRTVAAGCDTVPPGAVHQVAAAERAQVLTDLAVAFPGGAGLLAEPARDGPVAPRRHATHLMTEPPGVVAAVLTRAVAAGARARTDAILDELARGPGTVKWIGRLWHLAPEPAASAGRRPDLVDRYLDLVVQHSSPRQVAALIRELDEGDGGPMAARVMRMLQDDPGRIWVRPYIGYLLGDSERAPELCGTWNGDQVLLARAAAVEELRRQLTYGPAEFVPMERWQPALSLRTAERPLWLVRLGDFDAGSLIGLSDRGVHCHSVPGTISGGRIQQAPKEFRIDYEQFTHLTFAEEDHRIRIVRELGERRSVYFWAVDYAAGAAVRAVTTMLNEVAAVVRAIYAVRLDEPLGPSPSGWFNAART